MTETITQTGETSRFNPIQHITEHPIPTGTTELHELQDADWAFGPTGSHGGDYYTREEIIEMHLTVLGEAGPYQVLQCTLTGYESSVLIWDTQTETGVVFENEEGQFYSAARTILEATEDGTVPSGTETETDHGFPVTGISTHPLLIPEHELETFVANDDVLSVDFPNEPPHPDTLYLDYRTVLGTFGEWELFTVDTAKHQDTVFAWDSGIGEGVRINLANETTSDLLEAIVSVFDDSQRTGDGSCPRCLGEMTNRSYPHGMAIKCTSCGFQQDL